MSTALFPAAVMLGSMAVWLSFAVANNIRDPGTNIHLLGVMFRMELLDGDERLAHGLRQRAIFDPEFPRKVLRVVVAVQLITAFGLWLAAGLLGLACLSVVLPANAKSVAEISVALFMILWTGFLCGGMWFGYWMKMWHVQQVHFTLFSIGAVAFLLLKVS